MESYGILYEEITDLNQCKCMLVFIEKVFIMCINKVLMVYSCRNVPGSFQCSCPDGLVGDPVHTGCRNPGDCGTDVDCPPSASCIDNRCRNPCDSPASCGVNAECTTVNHSPQCRCPPQTRGDAKVNPTALRNRTLTRIFL